MFEGNGKAAVRILTCLLMSRKVAARQRLCSLARCLMVPDHEMALKKKQQPSSLNAQVNERCVVLTVSPVLDLLTDICSAVETRVIKSDLLSPDSSD